jgi:hypothetical protein
LPSDLLLIDRLPGKAAIESPYDFEDTVILPDGAAGKLPPNENYLPPFLGHRRDAAHLRIECNR